MKKIILSALLFLFISGSPKSYAQNKIGYINTEELMAAMPQTTKANSDLTEYQAALQKQNNDLLNELGLMDSLFVKDSAKLSEVQKRFRRDELIKLYTEVQGFSQKAQDLLQQRQQELVVPIRQAAMNAVQSVAKENGYSYILDINAVIVGPPGDNIMILVKNKLGIKETPAPRPNN